MQHFEIDQKIYVVLNLTLSLNYPHYIDIGKSLCILFMMRRNKSQIVEDNLYK